MVFRGWDGSSYVLSSALFATVDADTANPVGPGSIPGTIGFATSDDNGTTLKTLIFNSFGQLGVNTQIPTETLTVDGDASFTGPVKLAVYADDAARSAAIPTPQKGQLIFMTSGAAPVAANKVQVYDGSAWVNLH